ncbi:DUF3575 domain-containing protein [Bizionia gelidisalsuginis]|uniref:DUF3575 domain-containing protein n=2 Tax=Bizionia TaxID=283785 RepID=A0A8H2LCM2_9FLAO|nr:MULTISPECIES: DUF3575 domain-containing protein [Bizionia]TYB69406.1 DUF3575 domain-containing protein [Bizionia saleffrena]TYC08447.1 DUF3575 domain-containing protein [Bizionia gelidisalsuginis]
MIKRYHFIFITALSLFYAISLSAQTEVKFNMATGALLIPNFGVEFAISEHSSVQLDVLASFWDSFNGEPLQIIQVFPEFRYYLKPHREGLFVGGHVGFGMFTMQKPGFLVVYDKYQDPSTYGTPKKRAFESGRVTFYGLTLGYKKRFNPRWGIEFFVGGGLSQSNYKGYNGLERVDIEANNYRDFNGSGEVLLYRGGVMLIYALK